VTKCAYVLLAVDYGSSDVIGVFETHEDAERVERSRRSIGRDWMGGGPEYEIREFPLYPPGEPSHVPDDPPKYQASIHVRRDGTAEPAEVTRFRAYDMYLIELDGSYQETVGPFADGSWDAYAFGQTEDEVRRKAEARARLLATGL